MGEDDEEIGLRGVGSAVLVDDEEYWFLFTDCEMSRMTIGKNGTTKTRRGSRNRYCCRLV